MNSYLYTPYRSNHHISVFKSVIAGELHRLSITNRDEVDFIRHKKFFFDKLVERGYPFKLLQRIDSCFSFVVSQEKNKKQQLDRVANTSRSSSSAVVPFKLAYFQGAEGLHISSTLSRSFSLLEKVEQDVRIVVCWVSAKNLFRKRFSRFINL